MAYLPPLICRRRDEDTAAIRVSNLSENVQDNDLQDLFRPFGHIARIFLAKDKMTGQCKGFAFINYYKCVPITVLSCWQALQRPRCR